MRRYQTGSVVHYGFDHLTEYPDLVNAVFARHGGASAWPYATLNASLAVGDEAGAVVENRRRMAAALGFVLGDLVAAHQVHGTHVAIVSEADAGRGSLDAASALPETDALVTNLPGIMLSLRFADCVPVLLYDPVHRAVGIAHAGWRGTVGGVAAGTVAAMAGSFGTRPADLLAGIGPSIGPCCYNIDAPRAQLVRHSLPWSSEVLSLEREAPPHKDPWHLDLWLADRRQLMDAGLGEEHIQMAGLCTACRTDEFYSHRAEAGQTGRFAAVIGLRGN